MSTTLPSLSCFAPDAVFPQREILLDAESIAQRFSVEPTVRHVGGVTRCARILTKYRMGKSLRVLYRLACQDAEYLVSARAFPPGMSAAAYNQLAATCTISNFFPALMYAPDLETIFWTFPHDRKLSQLSALLSLPPVCRKLLGKSWNNARLVAYTPEKGATAQYLSATGDVVAYGKLYAEDKSRQCIKNHLWLYQHLPTDDPYVGLPRPLGYAVSSHMLLIEPQVGQRLREVTEAELPAGIAKLGAAVARFHQLPLPPGGSRFTRLDVDHLITAATLIGQARPDVASLASELATALVAALPASSGAAVCLHGDLHSKNGIVQNERLVLIDLDQVACGDAAAEIGSFLAELHYWFCIGRWTLEATCVAQAAFLRGYAEVSLLPEVATLRWYSAAALLVERALRAVNRVRECELVHLPAILRHAHHLLRGNANV